MTGILVGNTGYLKLLVNQEKRSTYKLRFKVMVGIGLNSLPVTSEFTV